MEFIFNYKRSDTGNTIYEKKIYDSSNKGALLQFTIWKAKEEDKYRISIRAVIREGAQSQ